MKNNVEFKGSLQMVLARVDSATSAEEWRIILDALRQCANYAEKCALLRERAELRTWQRGEQQ